MATKTSPADKYTAAKDAASIILEKALLSGADESDSRAAYWVAVMAAKREYDLTRKRIKTPQI